MHTCSYPAFISSHSAMPRSAGVHVALEQVTGGLNQLRRLSGSGERGFLSQLKKLQQSLRATQDLAADAKEIVGPFLSLIKAPAVPGSFKIVALNALDAFISYNVLLENPPRTSDALLEIVDTIMGYVFNVRTIGWEKTLSPNP